MIKLLSNSDIVFSIYRNKQRSIVSSLYRDQ